MMKAMMIKDLNLLKGQKQFFGIVIIMVALFTAVQENIGFAITYVTIMFSILTTTTMTYDDAGNGMCCLLTLPVSRRQYVAEKYIFGILSGTCGLLGTSALTVLFMRIKGASYPWEELGAVMTACIFLIALVLSVTTPIQLKFGAEKSRMALFGVFVGGVLAAFAASKICEAAGIDIGRILDSALIENLTTTVWGICITGAAMLGISYLISVRVLEKREF